MKKLLSLLLLAALCMGISGCAAKPDEAALNDIFGKADERRESILNSETLIMEGDSWQQGQTYSGTAYYVSNEGSDNNSGLSPETPWQSLDKVNAWPFKEGDAVFFRRGDSWHGMIAGRHSGITYSAYGQGPKPVFSGSLQDIAQADKWQLYYEGEDGKRIWQYHEELSDVSGIFFDSFSSYATKLLPAWDGRSYVTAQGEPFNIIAHAEEDLSFFSALNLEGQPQFFSVEEDKFTGPLYLRCDNGNPGEVFTDIQFICMGSGFEIHGSFGSGITLDNLAFRCYAEPAVSCAGYTGWNGTLIQNCEISYSGGMLKAYQETDEFSYGKTFVSGAAILMPGQDNIAVNNYIHDCDSKAFAIVIHDQIPELSDKVSTIYQGLHISGNLVENSGTAFILQDALMVDGSDKLGGFKDIVFEDNYVFYTGEGWVQHKMENTDPFNTGRYRSCICIDAPSASLENVQIRNNVLWGATNCLIYSDCAEGQRISLSGNVYAQKLIGLLCGDWGEKELFAIGAKGILEKNFGESQGTFYTIS